MKTLLRLIAAAALAAPLPLADAQTWTQATPSASPPARGRLAMAHDLARDRTVLFGGGDGLTPRADTWEYDGSTWTQITSPSAPSPLVDHALAYDQARGKVVLYGGFNLTFASLTETWEYDGGWTQVITANTPGSRANPALAYDVARSKVVLFGGRTVVGGSTLPTDTWEYDGSDWTRITTVTSPGGREYHAMVYDQSRGRVVLFGGTDTNSGNVLNDTWEYDGANWVPVFPTASPQAREKHALAYDVNRGRIVLFGGGPFSFSVLGDTWEYDGANGVWIQLPIPSTAAPPARASHGLVYDGARARVILFGGRVGFPTGAELADTWELLARAAPTWTRHGLGCAGSSGVPSLDPPANATPALGTPFPLHLTSLPPQPGMFMIGFGFGVEDYQGAPLPISLSTRGLPGCQMWVTSADINWLLPHGGVAATFPLQIPPDPWLAGLLVGTQAMVLDPGAPNGAGSVTNGGILVVH